MRVRESALAYLSLDERNTTSLIRENGFCNGMPLRFVSSRFSSFPKNAREFHTLCIAAKYKNNFFAWYLSGGYLHVQKYPLRSFEIVSGSFGIGDCAQFTMDRFISYLGKTSLVS